MTQTIAVELDDALVDAIDCWIARHQKPHPSRAEAIVSLLKGQLGAYSPSSTIPNLVTGRDIMEQS